MANADSNRVKIRFSRETVWGEDVAGPATTELRLTSETLEHSKETVTSETIRSDRQRDNVLEVGQSASGDIGFELAFADYESFFETALRNSISSATVALASTTVAASSITGPTGTNFITSFAAGQWIKNKTSGEIAKISSLTSTVLTTTGTTLVASTYVSAAVTGRTLINGTTKTSYFLEADFEDLTAVKHFSGMEIDGMTLSVASQQIITGAFTFVGKRGFTASTSQASTTASAGTNVPMTAAVNVLDIFEGGERLTNAVQSIDIALANNSRPRPQVASKTGAQPGDGGVDVTGQLNAYFEEIRMFNKLINHTTTSVDIKIDDVDGNMIIISLPAIKFSGGTPNAPGIDQDVFLPLDFVAFRDTTTDSTIRMDFLRA